MRKVFSNSMVAHVWAQQSQPEGRSANAQFYFWGDTIFSYGAHYPAARFTDAVWKGARVVLINCEKYSPTTQKHLRLIRGALRGLNVKIFDVPRLTEHHPSGYADAPEMHAKNLAHFAERLASQSKAMANLRMKPHLGWDGEGLIADTADNRVASLDRFIEDIHEYAGAFSIDRPPLGLEEKKSAIRDAFAKYNDPTAVAKHERAAAKRTAKREAEHFALIARARAFIEGVGPRVTYDEQAMLLRVNHRVYSDYISALGTFYAQSVKGPSVTPAQWQDGLGDANALGDSYHWGDPTLVRRQDTRLETSRGASVPFSHAVRAFHKAQACRRACATWRSNGDCCPVGVFQVDAIDRHGNIRAGCHTLGFDEMLRLAVREIPEQVKATFPVPALIAP